MDKKAYTLTLTQHQANLLCTMGGRGTSLPGTWGEVMSPLYYQLKGQGAMCTPSGKGPSHDDVYVFSTVKHGIQPDTTIRLTDSYAATVTKEAVVVGCQTIPWEKVEELLEARKKL